MSASASPLDRYTLRKATLVDAPVIARQRRLMFDAMRGLPEHEGREIEAAIRGYLERAMPAGTYHAWLIDCDEVPVAGGGIQLRTLMPRPGYTKGEPEGLILSMWTDPEHRRRGLGGRIVETMLEWGRVNGISRFTLHASDEGRPLYERYGFEPTNEMRLE